MPVGLVIVSHSTQLAAGVAELAGQMAQGKTPIAAAGGAGAAGENTLGTSVDKILVAIQSVESPEGVLVLLDLGSAILSAEMALEFLEEEQRSHVQFTIAPLVEGAVAAALEASLGRSLAEVKQAAERTATREQLQLLKPLSHPEVETEVGETAAPTETTETTAPTATPSIKPEANVLESSLPITNPTVLHARPASLFVQTAAQYNADIQVSSHGKSANAINIIGVLSLGARQGDTITFRVHGPQAEAALAALSELIRANFYETEPLLANPASAPEISRPMVQEMPPVGETMGSAEAVGAAGTAGTAGTAGATGTAGAVETVGGSEVWKGIPTSPGVALGPAFVVTASHLSLKTIERRPIVAEQVAAEQKRLREALTSAAEELHTLASNLQSSIGQEQAAIFDAQALMLSDEVLLEEALDKIAGQHIDAVSALADTGEQQATLLEGLENTLLAARAADVRDAVSRAVRSLRGQSAQGMNLGDLTSPVILLAHDLTPSDTALLRPETVLGICTVLGGPTAHAAILARALGIPAMAGLNEAALEIIHTGDELGLDADAGLLAVHPTEETRTQLAGRIAARQARQAALQAEARQAQAPLIFEERHISLLANVGSEAEAEAARQWGAEGIGLLRTEFLFAGAATLPDEEVQRQRYLQVFRAFIGPAPRKAGPVVVRTLDAGADKPMPALEAILGPISEANPALGLRGIRIHLAYPHLLEQQLSALLRAAAETGIDLHIMFPMISTVEEVHAVRTIFERVYTRLQQQSVAVPVYVPLGIMVEVPSAALMAPELAELVDFFSIGANDLLQYTLASDRTNTTVSHLYQATQPAVLRLIHQIAEAGRRAGKPVAVCGEIASDVQLAPLLVALGVDELSMTPTALPVVRAALSRRTTQELTALAERVGPLKTVAEVERELKA
jgi:phosphocarrier protein FPr